ncbi:MULTISPECIES: MoaD/ThiS family protein [Mycobacteriaceae]|uniref:MoaD/ThiS family protein n=1 Tax=Mycolicibacterium parafortuitum TaxID=39692 RepID=A0ACC6MJS7_MYCPF|nr:MULTISPECIES: MoaD/ThiS family protein [Mycobacteriaceae]MDZ5087241.1 MoaD/ThiS family protein [Mycolicibacterium parafortuitum]GFM17406.1 molybdopterin converting factor, small subunit [Mycobacterium sp. PO1]GFM25547.1 molybdopterin converting factor, small subunit [Mycobacterium sp. PO2]
MRAETTDAEARVTVRYFAAARAAAGVEDETITVPAGTTVGELVETLHNRGAGLSAVLARCSYLCDGVAVRDLQTALGDTQTVDVLPPFAGG